MDFLKDLWLFMKERKKFSLAPIIIILLLIGLIVVFGGSSAVAPFIYTLFNATIYWNTSRANCIII